MAIQTTLPATTTITPQPSRAEALPPGVRRTPTAAVDSLPPTGLQKKPEVTNTTDSAQINQALEEVRKAISPVAQDLRFSIDDDTGRTVVKIIDSSTDEVIKQIPSEEVLAIAKALDKLRGLLVRQEA
ncbi:flagellar protein FlaG [Aromatoleum toluolicum]|uniref:Flagellar protein n=1 Tax=Aromatoleum toluolicum TaxID=90060 RepID=A0ABX1NKA2_9RHOO|nr:flagellar protein FlaG [Aromatoleum toluolicum]NMF99666.1 flagellar protein FlaG [Aromatoleum toluolicum]